MIKTIINAMRGHDHWFAEWWSAVLLLSVGVYGLCYPDSFIIPQSFIDHFLTFAPFDLCPWLFIIFGLIQFFSLQCDFMIWRGISAFFSSSLLLWGALNITVYGHLHVSLVAWGVPAMMNLYALSRITRGIKEKYIIYCVGCNKKI